MRSILLKGMDHSYKSNIYFLKSTIERINNNRNQLNKNPIKSRLLFQRKNTNIHDIYFPQSVNFNKINDNSFNDKKDYCPTEGNAIRNNEINLKKNDNFFKKILLLPKIKGNGRILLKKPVNLGLNKYSLNLNLGCALSCEKILLDKNKKPKALNELREKSEKTNLYVKKIILKEMALSKNKSENRGRIIGNFFKLKKRLNYSKKDEQNRNMNDIVISNDFHGSKVINFDDNWNKNLDKLNIYMKYKKGDPLNKRSSNNNEYEKNQSLDANSSNKKKHFRSFQNITKLSPPRKISKTISGINNSESRNNNLYTVNFQRNNTRKIKNYNDDIINLLNDSG